MRSETRLRNSLALKLSLSFLFVGLIGVLVVSLIINRQTRNAFDRFISERDRSVQVKALAKYYSQNNSWEGIQVAVANSDYFEPDDGLVVIDTSGFVVVGNREFQRGDRIRRAYVSRENFIPIVVDYQPVGYILTPPQPPPTILQRPEVEQTFLNQLSRAINLSVIIAIVFALLVGAILARTLTRPIRELIAATKTLAQGTFDHRVQVRSNDEIGLLAESFNQMSADLAHASQLRKQMTADLAHDLRTPLSILRGYTEGLKDERIDGTPVLYGILHEEVEHLQRLVEDLRVLSLADAGELTLTKRAVDPQALLERVGLAYIVQAEEQGINLTVTPAEELPSVYVDTDRINQVLKNLVSNALRHTKQGTITLAAAHVGPSVHLSISDTGSGIPAEDVPFVFDRFYRADKSRQRSDTASSGLGLAIAKAIIEAHAGTLEVDSTVGQGTTFRIRLSVA